MSKVYVFSGLGVDKRVFDGIDFSGLDVEFIDWLPPLKKESIERYAERMAHKITAKDAILIGLSFGGMIAVEISKIIKVQKVILIASAKNNNELPVVYRIFGKLGLNKIVPTAVLKQHSFMTNWFFGAETPAEKKMLKNILNDTDSYFLRWAINEIINWKNTLQPENCIHIQGAKDRIIPAGNCKADYLIENGGHFITVNRAKEIEKIIKEECREF